MYCCGTGTHTWNATSISTGIPSVAVPCWYNYKEQYRYYDSALLEMAFHPPSHMADKRKLVCTGWTGPYPTGAGNRQSKKPKMATKQYAQWVAHITDNDLYFKSPFTDMFLIPGKMETKADQGHPTVQKRAIFFCEFSRLRQLLGCARAISPRHWHQPGIRQKGQRT